MLHSLYQLSLLAIVYDFFPANFAGQWKLPLHSFVPPFWRLFFDLIYWKGTFDKVLDEYMTQRDKLPSLDPSAKAELIKLLPQHIPLTILPDLWDVLLKREFELTFLYFWQENEFLNDWHIFEDEDVERFKGSQLLYSYFQKRQEQQRIEFQQTPFSRDLYCYEVFNLL